MQHSSGVSPEKKNIPWKWTIVAREWTWNCCWLVCTAEWKIAIITCACSHVLRLGMHARCDSYRFVFALLFVRSLSPRLFMRFPRGSQGRRVNISGRFVFFSVSDMVYHLVDFTFAARLHFNKRRSSRAVPGIHEQTVRHQCRRQSY